MQRIWLSRKDMLSLVCVQDETLHWRRILIGIVIDNVTFGYDPRQTALNGISFSIPKGATVALVGPSGGG